MIQIILILLTLCYFVYYGVTKKLNYWKDRNVVGPKPLFLFGNVKASALRRTTIGEVFKGIYGEFPKDKVVGVFRMTTPCLLLRDLDVVKHILIKDFNNFADRGFEISDEGLGNNLFHSHGATWQILRNKMTPLFTSGKLKNMFHLMTNKTDQFINLVDKVTSHTRENKIYDLVSKYTLSNIAACAFGLDINVEDEMADLKAINNIINKLSYGNEVDMMFPGILKALNMSTFPKSARDFFHNLVIKVQNERQGVPTIRKDFMDLILELKQEKEVKTSIKFTDEAMKLEITDNIIAAQAFIFYVAGYDTSATTMSYLLYELAMNPEIQNKVISEIDEVLEKSNNELTYDCLNEMTYLGKVFDETLRLYPLAEPLQRQALNDYKVPGTDVLVKKGQIVLISGWGIHHDEKYYSNPTKFDPERFDPQNSKDRHSCAYLPFGAGPRNCIGLRFGKVQSKLGIAKLLSKYRVERSARTQQRMEFDPYIPILSPKGGIYLNIIPRF